MKTEELTAALRGQSGETPLIEAVGLAAGYGSVAVIHDINLTVRPGEVAALLGPNGAGKSTLLHALSGKLAPLSGEVRWKGLPTHARMDERARAGLAVVPEGRGVFMGLSTRANLRLGRGSVEAAEGLFPELTPLLSRRAGLLSGGEQQIVSVGRALAGAPVLLLADELSLGLAPLVVDRLLAAIKTAAERGLGVLLVEQHIHRAMEIADSVHVLRRGRLVFSGSAADIADQYGSIEAAYLSEPEADLAPSDIASARRGESTT